MITREQTDLSGFATGAKFSPCLCYRYALWRQWNPELPMINFIMLNPSTADEVKNDPTVERCERRAREMQFGTLYVTNLYAWRATDPKELKKVADPVGPENTAEILHWAKRAAMVICAWGIRGERGGEVRTLLRAAGVQLHCLKKTDGDHPWHPLYVPYAKQPEPF